MKKIIAITVFILFLFFVAKTVIWSTRFMRQTGITPVLLARFTFDDGALLQSSNNRTDILILGVGGGGA